MSLLEVKNVKKIYTTRFSNQQVQALSNVTFSVEKGEYVAIMGDVYKRQGMDFINILEKYGFMDQNDIEVDASEYQLKNIDLYPYVPNDIYEKFFR